MPLALIVALTVQLACQLFKFIVYSVRDRKISPRYLVTAGGMPSAHSAFVASLSAWIGLRFGFDSPAFSVAAVFAFIVMYDAFRLRGHVQHHAKAINSILDYFEGSTSTAAGELKLPDRQNEMVGHSLVEVGSGLVLGILWSMFIHFVVLPL